jgi:hypothetical protein
LLIISFKVLEELIKNSVPDSITVSCLPSETSLKLACVGSIFFELTPEDSLIE